MNTQTHETTTAEKIAAMRAEAAGIAAHEDAAYNEVRAKLNAVASRIREKDTSTISPVSAGEKEVAGNGCPVSLPTPTKSQTLTPASGVVSRVDASESPGVGRKGMTLYRIERRGGYFFHWYPTKLANLSFARAREQARLAYSLERWGGVYRVVNQSTGAVAFRIGRALK